MSLAEIKMAVDELSPDELTELTSFIHEREKASYSPAEEAEDLAIARAALARIAAGEKTYSLDELEKQLGL